MKDSKYQCLAKDFAVTAHLLFDIANARRKDRRKKKNSKEDF